MFPVDEILVLTSWNVGLAEKYVPVKGKTASTGTSLSLSEKTEKKLFPLARKLVLFILQKKMVYTSREIYFQCSE